MPDVICHGGGELSESTHGEGGTDGQRPDSNTPETNDASAEELSSQATPQGDVPTTGDDKSEGSPPAEPEADPGGDDAPEPEFIAGGASAFKTSGTFFRDRVAKNLASQGYGMDDVPSSELNTEPGDAPEAGDSEEADSDTATEAVGDSDSEPSTSAAPFAAEAPEDTEDTEDTESAETTDPDNEATGVFPLPNLAQANEGETDAESGESGESAESAAEEPKEQGPAQEGETDDPEPGEVAEGPTGPDGVDSPLAAADATAGPETLPFTPPSETGSDDGLDKETDVEPDEGTATEAVGTESKADDEDQRTEAMPAPGAGAVAFSAPPPEEKPEVPEDTDRTTEQQAAPVDDEIWPQPRRFSDYVSDREGKDDDPSAAAAGGLAGAAASPASAHAVPGGLGGPGGPAGPGGPKGPPGGPGGPKGPGDKGSKDDKKQKPKKPLWWRILRVFLVVTGLMIIVAGGVFAFFYSTVEIPDAAKADAVEQGSTFYFADGETEFAYRGTDREVVDYEDMTAGGDHVVEAVISAEDRGFWTEPGVSVSGTARAVWSTVTGEQVQGGSTVTQQMVRNYYEGVSLEQTVARKVQEIIIAIKVDQNEDKEWVMEQYLNTIYFGRQAYGIQAAAQAYYHKDVGELTAEESAFLAAAIQQPTRFGQADVETTPAMENRWQYVINGMVTTEAITQAEADQMEFPAPEPEKPMAGGDISGYNGYMLQEALSELEDLGYTEDHINRQGYKIVTTFDKGMMDAAYESVEAMVAPETLPEGVNIGLTTIDPATGEVKAFYGGHDYVANQYDSAFLGAAQAGSAFKPYVLATALEQGYGLNSTVDGRGPQDVQGSRVQNAGNAPGGVMTLTQATQVSNNLGFVELAQEVGFEEVRQTAYDVGLPEGSIDDNQLVPVMPLGASSVRPVDQASGFGTFANGGVHMEAHVVKEVVNQAGDDERPEVAENRALEETTASDVTHALEGVVNGGTGTAAQLANHPVAGKTGTTDGSVAAWFVGYTPQLSTAVGVYSGNNESFSIPGHNISGGGLPASMWNSYMSRAMEGYDRGSFPDPAFDGTTENWAPDPATQEPQEPQEPQVPQEPQEPQEPEEPPEPEIPEIPEDPEIPEVPEDPGWPEDPGIPEMPPTTRSEDG